MAAEEGQVISCHTDAVWKEHFERAKEANKLVVIDFTAAWCGPCRMIAPIVADLAKRFPYVVFLKVDVDELKAVAAKYVIEAMPTFIFLKDGNVVDKIVGANKEDLSCKVEKFSETAAPSTA